MLIYPTLSLNAHTYPSQEELESRNASCHPINTLPIELLEAIIWLALDMTNPTHPGHRSRGEHKPNDILLGFIRVCRHWRATLIGSPRLWSHLDIELRSGVPGVATSRPTTRQIQLWLQRSRDHPLRIKFVADRASASLTHLAFERICQAILSLLFAHARRWEDVHLALDDLDLSRIVLPLVKDVPLLKRLRLQATVSTLTLPPPTGTLLRRARLTSFHGEFDEYPFHTSPHPIVWSTLTQLSLQCEQSPLDCLNLLLNASNLHDCTLEGIDIGGPCPSTALPNQHILPHLHTLRLLGRGHICSILLPNLLMPSLKTLSVISTTTTHIHPDDTPTNARSGLPLVTFLFQSPSQESITQLIIAAIRLREDALCSFLPLLVNLQSLEILCMDFGTESLGDMLVETLDPDSSSPSSSTTALPSTILQDPRSSLDSDSQTRPPPSSRLPKLTTLKIYGNFDPQDGLLSTMLVKRVGEEAKKRGIVSLQRIQIEYCYSAPPHVEDERRLLELQKQAILHQVIIR